MRRLNLPFEIQLTLGFIVIFILLFTVFFPRAKQQLEQRYNQQECRRLYTRLSTELTKVNYCQEATDCRLAPVTCPYSCYPLINNREYSKIAQLAGLLYQKCLKCNQDCGPVPSPQQFMCVNNHCQLNQ